MAWPYRTGLPTANQSARELQRVLVKYADVQAGILNPDQLEKIAALLLCLSEFLADVPAHEPIS